MAHIDALVNENNRKDLLIAQLKAEAFELRQKVRDYQALHERYSSLEVRFNSMVDLEGSKQAELKNQLHYTTTASQSLVREIEELKAIHREQLQRLQQTD